MQHQFILHREGKLPITLDVTYAANGLPKPIVIFVHGFKGFKDWGHFNQLAKLMAQNDFVFLKFNFSHNGTSPENLLEFADLDAFGNNNYGIELDDMDNVIDWITTHDVLKNEINIERVYMIGHSRGGAVSVLKAAKDNRIKKLVTWAAVADLVNRNSPKTIGTWEKEGVVFAYNARTKQQMPLYKQFYTYIQEHKNELNVVEAASRLPIPYLIIHGTLDEAVPVNDAHALKKANPQAELFIVDGADHTFGVKHPFDGNMPVHVAQVIQKTIEFFKK